MPIELTIAIIGIVAAILGYAFREFRNRARPFFHITKVDGTIIRKSDRVPVTEEIRKNLETSFYIGNLSPSPELGVIGTTWNSADDVKQYWPDVENKIRETLTAASGENFITRLSEAFNMRFFEKMLLTCLVVDKITVNHKLTSDAPEVIPIYDEEEYEGSVWICFPERARQFGNHFKVPAIRAKCQPFLNAIQQFDKDAIISVLNCFLAVMHREYQTALRVEQPLHDIRNENSRWVFYAYFANLGSYPVIIHRDARLVVQDPASKPFKEGCYLAVLKEDSICDTDTPVVVKPGDDASICFITNNIQKEMPLGTAIRESYNRGQAYCRIHIKVTKIGLLKTQGVWSSKAVFRSSIKQKDAPGVG